MRDVISVVREIYRRNKQRAVSSSNSSKPDLYREEMEYPAIREAVIAQEQVLLRATAFNTRADIPHKYLLNVARCVLPPDLPLLLLSYFCVLHLVALSLVQSLSRALCLSCPVVQYAYALLNDCFLDARCMDMSSMALACACLHLGVLYVCLEEGGGGEGGGGEDPTETCQPQQRLPSSDFATLPALLPSEAPTARACLKVPAHELHGVLRSAWWSLHFDVSHDDFWNTAAFVVHANSSSGTVEEDSVSCGSEKN